MRRECSADEVERLAREALPLLEAAKDDDGLAHVWYALAWVANMRQRFEDWAQGDGDGMRHARRAGHPVFGVVHDDAGGGAGVGAAAGGRGAGDARRRPRRPSVSRAASCCEPCCSRCSTGSTRPGRSPCPRGSASASSASLPAANGSPRSRSSPATTKRQPATSATPATRSRRSATSGELSTYAPMLGRVLCLLGRYDEAELLAQRGRELGDSRGRHDTANLAADAGARALGARSSTPRRSGSPAKRSTSRCGATHP